MQPDEKEEINLICIKKFKLNPAIHSKLPAVGTTIFTVMSSLALKHEAVNLGQGFPDFPMNPELVSLVNKAMQNGFNQYTHMSGYPPLREAIAEKIQRLYGATVHPESEITITPGGTYAIYTALTSVLREGDEVIVFEPGYDSYVPNVEINGAKAILIPLRIPDYSIDWDLVRQAISPRTRMIMLNSPHNPTGRVLQEHDIEQLRSVVNITGIFILSDEVYEHLIYDGIPHLSMLRYPDLMERSFVCFSFGKVYHCTGWKLGYCVARKEWMKEFRKVHQFNCFSCDTPKQVAMAEFLEREDEYLSLGAFMQKKRDYFLELMKNTKFRMYHSYGSYFVLGSFSHFSEESEIDLTMRLTRDYGVVTIPVSAFYKNENDHKVLRFCFAKKEETLEKAVERLRKV